MGYLLLGCSISTDKLFDKYLKSIVIINYGEEDVPGYGTGFIIKGKNGYCTVVTTAHVIQLSSKINIKLLGDESEKPRKVVNIIPLPGADLALLEFKPRSGTKCPYKNLKLGNSSKISLGEEIRIFGYTDIRKEPHI